MRIGRADRSATLRPGARPAPDRYAVTRARDGTAPALALGAPLIGTLVLLLARLLLPA